MQARNVSSDRAVTAVRILVSQDRQVNRDAPVRMVNQNWWITTLMVQQHKYCPPLTKDIKCDVLIVGGGFSGISAAAEFLRKGLSVVLIEKNIVGGSSSGRSAGFLTPDSELELHQLVRRYGAKAAGGDLGSALPRHRPHRRAPSRSTTSNADC